MGTAQWAPGDGVGEENAEAGSLIEGTVLGGGWGRDLELMYSFICSFAREIFPDPYSGILANGSGDKTWSCPQEATFTAKQAGK